MREIEIKARVENLDSIIDALKAQGAEVTEPVTQHDVVYGPNGVDGGGDNTAPWLRIRTETRDDETTHFFTLKKSVTNQLDSIEHETIVENAEELEKIISLLDFELYSDLTKTRQKTHINEIEICLDYVDGLGYFVEAEKLTSDDIDYPEVIEGLWVLLESIGVSRADEVTDGYDVLMNKQLAKA
jgi:adenylate cyclase class 2